MYLKKIIYKNSGALKNININLPFNDENSPKPLIIVGENGSGKSTFLSNIVDSLYEIAGKAFNNVRLVSKGNEYQFYKIISNTQISIGNKYLYSYIQYDECVEYVFKCGMLSFEDFKRETGVSSFSGIWNEESNFKHTTIDKVKAEKEFTKNIFAYFGRDRYEKPNWMGEKYFNINDYEHPHTAPHYNGTLDNPLIVKNVTALNLQWLLDLIVDSRVDIQYIEDKKQIELIHLPDNNINNLLALKNCRNKIEEIMGTILKQKVYFDLNVRSNNGARFNIKNAKTNKIIVSQLDALSTGELALFNMFSTIVKYADKLDINNSIDFEQIKGIVVIDEIELHLHSSMQKEVLPKLIKLFPKVQFIITTHSPLFLLGMNDEFGEDNFDIYQLPHGNKITAESFSEFKNAFDYMRKTQQYQNEVQLAIQATENTKPLIITEGATDWRHIKAAMNALSKKAQYQYIFNNMNINLLEFDSKNSTSELIQKLEMGNGTLHNMCKEFSKIKQTRKMIFIADRDDKNINNKLYSDNPYKDWGNNVFSILLPIPLHRKNTPNICIEHYYSDNEIKTPVKIDGIDRRLYIGNEFDNCGRHIKEQVLCEKPKICGKDKINIIEGSDGERVLSNQPNSNTNLALSKMLFAQKILKAEEPFNNIDFEPFMELFNIIKQILELPLV